MAQLDINNLSIYFGDVKAVNDVSFSLSQGEIGCLLGPSGCGKTTILRAIAGFEKPVAGDISLDTQLISNTQTVLATEKRQVGMVFQDFALFPHLNISDNIAFGLNTLPTHQQQQRVNELLTLVDLQGLQQKFPHELSGGQQQRVALARAIAPKPNILLLDEPFSSIDIEFREQLAHDIRDILKKENITGLLVTHDQIEAFAVADHIGVMNAGQLHQWDTGYNLYHEPVDLFVADFVGRGVFIKGLVLEKNKIQTDLGLINKPLNKDIQIGDEVDILIRPDDVIHDDASKQTAKVIEKSFQGAEFLYTLALSSGTQVLCFAPSHHNHLINEAIGIRLELDHLVVFKHENK